MSSLSTFLGCLPWICSVDASCLNIQSELVKTVSLRAPGLKTEVLIKFMYSSGLTLKDHVFSSEHAGTIFSWPFISLSTAIRVMTLGKLQH